MSNELVIRIKRDDAEARAAARSYYAAEKKGVQQFLTDAEVAERARTEIIKRENRQRIQEAANATKTSVEHAKAAAKAIADAEKQASREAAEAAKQAAQAEKQAAKEKTEAQKRSARETLEAVKQQIAESKQLERELFEEGRQLANQKLTREKQDEKNAVASSKLAFGERKKLFDAQIKATDDASAATRQMTRALLGTQVAGAALQGVRTLIDAMGQSAAATGVHIRAMIREAEAARHLDREIAALTDNKATVLFSAQQAGEAARAGVSPEEYRAAQAAFQAQAGQFVGDDALSKISQTDAADLLQRVTSFSASQGVDAQDSARLMGVIIGKEGEGQTNKDRMTTFGKLFKALQLAAGPTGPLIGQLTELAQEEVGPGDTFNSILEAVPLIRAMADRNAGEASTYGRALIRGLREIRRSPEKMDQLGLTKDMDFNAQIKQIAKLASESGDEGDFLAKFFPDIRSFGGVRTAISMGIKGKGLERVQKEMAGVTAASIDADVRTYRLSEEGVTQRQQAEIARARLERANRSVPLEAIRREARIAVLASGELESREGVFGAIATRAGEAFGQGDREQQLVTAETGRIIAERLKGTDAGRRWMVDNGLWPGQSPFSLGSRGASETNLVEAARMIQQFTAAANQLHEAAKAVKQANEKPVPAAIGGSPPRGPGRL